MTRHRFTVGQAVMDRARQAHGEVVGLYASPLVVRLADKASGFEWVARTVDCEQLAAKQSAPKEPAQTPAFADRVAVDVVPTELRVGDHRPGRATRAVMPALGDLVMTRRTPNANADRRQPGTPPARCHGGSCRAIGPRAL